MLELRGVGVRLGEFVLSPLDLTVASGEYFVLMGPSGGGKTVLLEIIAGLVHPAHGQVLWDGEDITGHAPEVRRIAMAYQDYALFPHMNVARNIGYGLRARGLAREIVEERVRALAARLGIEPLLGRGVRSLSGGEKQRVATARALLIEPRLLLLDEPLSAVDADARAQLRGELRRIHAETRASILHVTHDAEDALALGERVGVLLAGRLQRVGPPAEVLRSAPAR